MIKQLIKNNDTFKILYRKEKNKQLIPKNLIKINTIDSITTKPQSLTTQYKAKFIQIRKHTSLFDLFQNTTTHQKIVN